ncbi:hypothetical protein AUP68_11371 [Ilyonectria robusta]
MIPDALDVQHQSPCKPCIFFLLPALLLSLPLFLALSVLSFGFAESDSAFSPLSLKDTQASNRPLARAANTDNPCLHPASIHTYLLPALLGAKSTHTLIINLHSPLHCRPDLQPLTSQLVGITSTLTIDTLSSFNMVRSSSAEPAKVTKLKGTRSVSTLTPSQLACKRAKDREAQRAKRAQTKEYVAGLESELEDLKGKQSRFQALEQLLRRKQALELKLLRLNEEIDLLVTTLTSSTGEAVYDDNLNTSTGAIRSPRASPPSPDLLSDCEPWANPVPVQPNVSSESLSANADDYGAGNIPVSISAVDCLRDIKFEYDEVYHHNASIGSVNPSKPSALSPHTQPQQQQQQQQQQHQQPAWYTYPAYPQAQSSVY